MLWKVAGAIRTFIDAVSLTMDKPSEVAKASFAKVLIEMDINVPHVPSFLVQIPRKEAFLGFCSLSHVPKNLF